VQVTISCSVAAVDQRADSAEDLVRRADASLYQAKKTRNSVAAVESSQEKARAVGDKV
jgi:PleD family two-component response regulator